MVLSLPALGRASVWVWTRPITPPIMRQVQRYPCLVDLLMGLFRGAAFHHGRAPENCPLVLVVHFPSLRGRFPTLMGRFPECLNGLFSLLQNHWKTAH